MELKFFLGYLIIVNLVAFGMYAIDKRKARKHKWRIPEAQLLGIAALGGALGAWAGMSTFRHKTQHLKFKYGIPAILIIQLIIAVFLYGH